MRRCASVERLRTLFDFVPSTPLADGLRQAALWLHATGYRPDGHRREAARADPLRRRTLRRHRAVSPAGCSPGHASRARVSACCVFSDHRGVVDETTAQQARREFADNIAWLRAESGNDVRDHSGEMLPACRGAFEAERARSTRRWRRCATSTTWSVTHAATDTNQDHRQVAEEASARASRRTPTLLGGRVSQQRRRRLRAARVRRAVRPGARGKRAHGGELPVAGFRRPPVRRRRRGAGARAGARLADPRSRRRRRSRSPTRVVVRSLR